LSFSGFIWFTRFVFGSEPIATNIPSALIELPDFSLISSTKNFPLISSTSSLRANSIFSTFFACSTQMSSALNVSLLWTIVTLLHNSARYSASVNAVFQPQASTTSLHLKKFPSQVAQYDTHFPSISSSPFAPKCL
jgi:hypothetical protein